MVAKGGINCYHVVPEADDDQYSDDLTSLDPQLSKLSSDSLSSRDANI